MVVKGFFSEVVESVRHSQMVRTNRAANSLALRPNLAAREAGPARDVTRTITRPIRKEHFGLSTRRAPSSPHSISASLNP
jgi:hypothetical protein